MLICSRSARNGARSDLPFKQSMTWSLESPADAAYNLVPPSWYDIDEMGDPICCPAADAPADMTAPIPGTPGDEKSIIFERVLYPGMVILDLRFRKVQASSCTSSSLYHLLVILVGVLDVVRRTMHGAASCCCSPLALVVVLVGFSIFVEEVWRG